MAYFLQLINGPTGLGAIKQGGPALEPMLLQPPKGIDIPTGAGSWGTYQDPPLPDGGLPPPPPSPPVRPPSASWVGSLFPSLTTTPTTSPGYLPPREVPTVPPPSGETVPRPPIPPAPPHEIETAPPIPPPSETPPPEQVPEENALPGAEESVTDFLPTTSMAKALIWMRGHKKEVALGTLAIVGIGFGLSLLKKVSGGISGSASSGFPSCVKFHSRTHRCLAWSDGWTPAMRKGK